LQSLGSHSSRRFDALFHEFVDLGLRENADSLVRNFLKCAEKVIRQA
jgi:hypothetical protein